jgi:arylsulfatase A-like enzyme
MSPTGNRSGRPRVAFGALAVGTGFALAWALAGSFVASPAGRTGFRGARPSVILISIDTLRADRMSVYGYGRETTPGLERLAAESILFDSFYYSGGGTLPSHMTMMTSLNPATHGIHPGSRKVLEAERETLAELLRAEGYATAGYTDGGFTAGTFGFSQGFDVYDDTNHGLRKSLPKLREWLRTQPGKPLFVFLHTYDVHSQWRELPYDCPGDAELAFVDAPSPTLEPCGNGLCASRYLSWINGEILAGRQTTFERISREDARYVSTLYDGCIRYVDGMLAGFFDELRAAGIYDDALIVVTSDHGEEFGEHGLWLHEQGGYEELAHIPLLLKLPRARMAGRRVASLGAMVDLLPTILDVAGVAPPREAQGRSLLEALAGGERSSRSVHMYSVLRTPGYKYFSDERRLFDLAADPSEQRNLFNDRPDEIGRLEEEVRGLIDVDHAAAARFADRVRSSSAPALSPEEIEKLRALGYLR